MIVPSLPGFPGATGHTLLDTHLDWVLAIRQLVEKAGLDGADLVGSSVGGSFAAEMAAMWPASVKKLSLIAPFGLFDDMVAYLDRVLSERPFAAGDRFTAADTQLGTATPQRADLFSGWDNRGNLRNPNETLVSGAEPASYERRPATGD